MFLAQRIIALFHYRDVLRRILFHHSHVFSFLALFHILSKFGIRAKIPFLSSIIYSGDSHLHKFIFVILYITSRLVVPSKCAVSYYTSFRGRVFVQNPEAEYLYRRGRVFVFQRQSICIESISLPRYIVPATATTQEHPHVCLCTMPFPNQADFYQK